MKILTYNELSIYIEHIFCVIVRSDIKFSCIKYKGDKL